MSPSHVNFFVKHSVVYKYVCGLLIGNITQICLYNTINKMFCTSESVHLCLADTKSSKTEPGEVTSPPHSSNKNDDNMKRERESQDSDDDDDDEEEEGDLLEEEEEEEEVRWD